MRIAFILIACVFAPVCTSAQTTGKPRTVSNIEYHAIEGVDKSLLSLDLYIPQGKSESKRPTMIMIHGGGWKGGDKANENIAGAKMQHFVREGYIYASINYRLSTRRSGVKHPMHAQDCARALAWIHKHIDEYGGDSGKLHLMGHSAGAHLAGLLATNERFLKSVGQDLSILKTCVMLDTAAIDIPDYLKKHGGILISRLYKNAFGEKASDLIDASPARHIEANKSIPPLILFYSGQRMGMNELAPAFVRALRNAKVPAQAIDTVDLSHSEINALIGTKGDEMTKLIMRLLGGEDPNAFPKVLPGKKKQN